jgi:hypothetical protein
MNSWISIDRMGFDFNFFLCLNCGKRTCACFNLGDYMREKGVSVLGQAAWNGPTELDGNKKRKKGRWLGRSEELAQDGVENFKSLSIFPNLIQNQNEFERILLRCKT